MTRRMMRYTVRFFASIGFVATALAVWLWATYPKAPDISKATLDESLAYMGSEDFNRMFEFHRRQYALDLVEKMREKSFDELLQMILSRNPAHREVAKNLRDAGFRDEVESAVFTLMLDKFYEQPEAKRTVYLTMAVMMEGRAAERRPGDFQIPSPDRLKEDMGEFMSRQPPNVQGKTARLIMDIRKQRKIMGMKDPW